MISRICFQWPILDLTRKSNPKPFQLYFYVLVLDMLNLKSCSNGSQFFITTVPTPHLNGKHTVFGKVIEGTEFVDAIEGVGSSDGTPNSKVLIQDCGSL